MRKWKNKEIDIFGTKYTIEFVPNTWENADGSGSKVYGEIICELKKIKVALRNSENKPFNDEEIILTILHEIIHAILGEGCYFNETYNEAHVEWLAKCIRSLIKQDLLKWNI